MNLEDIFDISEFEHKDIFKDINYVWETLEKIKKYIKEHINPNVSSIANKEGILPRIYVTYKGVIIEGGFRLVVGDATKGEFGVYVNEEKLEGATVIYSGATLADEQIYIGKGTVIEPGAYIKGPTIIGNNCEIRQGAYIRGNVLVGNGCIVGHTTEVKNACFLNQAKAGHFAYIGDSILGNKVNLGAGTKLANLNIRNAPIQLRLNGKDINTNLRKFGAILGDDVETGCNSVTNPGTILGKGCAVYPNTTVKKGYYPPKTIIR
ncbi:MAG: glucose-1-phosphate thymidylyltransferase [bacterium]|nr:glucose-1-phosphate thymidylyltransferase [bacterium]